jgi:Flp pilus assembly protein TadG
MVEFAMATTFTLGLVFGILEFGRALYDYHLVASAARLGARYAIVHGATCNVAGCPTTASAVQTYVQGLTPGVDSTQVTVTALTWASTPVCYTSPYQNGGCQVTVTVQYPFSFVGLPIQIASFTMSSTSVMTVAQ